MNWREEPLKEFIVMALTPISLPLVMVLWRRPYTLTAVLLLLSAVSLYIKNDRKFVLFFIFTGLSGAAAEYLGIHSGAWKYMEPQVLGLPLWLPILWGVAALYMQSQYHLAEWLYDNREKVADKLRNLT
jgi:hypothetical protein